MTDHATIFDLRSYDFETRNELHELVQEGCQHVAECHPGMRLGVVIISERQQKLLNLERYEKGVPLHVIRKESLGAVDDIPLVTTKFEEGCPNCGDVTHWQ